MMDNLKEEIEINQVVSVLKGIHQNGREWQILVVDEKYMIDQNVHKRLVEKYGLKVIEFNRSEKGTKKE